MTKAEQALQKKQPCVRIIAFGHMGDGNLHYNLSKPTGMADDEFRAMWDDFNRIIHDLVMGMGGSFSAEHGIGQLKRRDLARYASPTEIGLMTSVKAALDPLNIMNPGKVIPDRIDK
jgi:FAD/FMN-containing dehydrogenase